MTTHRRIRKLMKAGDWPTALDLASATDLINDPIVFQGYAAMQAQIDDNWTTDVLAALERIERLIGGNHAQG